MTALANRKCPDSVEKGRQVRRGRRREERGKLGEARERETWNQEVSKTGLVEKKRGQNKTEDLYNAQKEISRGTCL